VFKSREVTIKVKRKPTIRQSQKDDPANPQNPEHALDREKRIFEVLNHMVSNKEVLAGIRDPFARFQVGDIGERLQVFGHPFVASLHECVGVPICIPDHDPFRNRQWGIQSTKLNPLTTDVSVGKSAPSDVLEPAKIEIRGLFENLSDYLPGRCWESFFDSRSHLR
jgi:hypothetical protein